MELIENLNLRRVETDYMPASLEKTRTDTAKALDGLVTVHFSQLTEKLVEYIQEAEVIVGCVAWLTHPEILTALATRPSVSIVVQKEDFLRPDIAPQAEWAERLRQQYKALRGIWRFSLPGIGRDLSICCDPVSEGVRCVGNHNSMKIPAVPRMHHKFLVFCTETQMPPGCPGFIPYAVWTGSFNFTRNATYSFENAIIIHDRTIADAYMKEYCHILGLSEPLDWESPWMAPEYRIGT